MAPPVGNLIPLPSAAPDASTSYHADDPEIASAISRAQENLLRQQHPDGHWCGELIVDSTLCSDYVLFMHWLGEVDDALQQRCVRHILKRQLSDGGWNIYYGGPSEVNASVKAYFALKLAGHSADLPFMQEARANILRLGGIPKMNTFSKLYLALLGQFPWQYLPSIPVEMILFPNWAFFNIHKMSSWSRAMLKRALEEAERWMLERIGEGSDGLAAVFPAMLNALIALRALGYSPSHPVYAKAAKDFAGLFVDDPEDF